MDKTTLKIALAAALQMQLIAVFAGKLMAAGGPTSPYGPPPEYTGFADVETISLIGMGIWIVGTLFLGNMSLLLKKLETFVN